MRWFTIKKIFILIFLILFGFIVYNIVFSSKDKYPLAKVYRLESSIVYDGDLSIEGIEQVKKLYSEDINNIILNSLGGEINLGMDLGEWIYDHKLDVTIKYTAFSSAANYIFPAGQRKFLYKNSFIGWHGGATQEPTTFYEKLFVKFILSDYIKKSKLREENYFKKINVNPRITTLGQQEVYKKYGKEYKGWTYSLDALSELGVNNIILIDEEWSPITEFKSAKLFIIDNSKVL